MSDQNIIEISAALEREQRVYHALLVSAVASLVSSGALPKNIASFVKNSVMASAKENERDELDSVTDQMVFAVNKLSGALSESRNKLD